MGERHIFTTSDGWFDAFLYRPAARAAPGILMIPEVFGRSPQLLDIAAEFADAGFFVGVLDIHWRVEVGVALAPREVERARRLHQRLDYDLAVSDIDIAVRQFRSAPGCTGKIGIVGFCLGGTLAWRAAARTSADAAVSYYGTRIQDYLADGAVIERPLLLHLGEADPFTPPDVIARIERATKENSLVECFCYTGVGHAFCNPAQPHFNAAAAALAHRRSFDFLRRHLSDAGV